MEAFDDFVQKLRDMIPASAYAPVDEDAIIKSKFMPKRTSIVSGKVLTASAAEKARRKQQQDEPVAASTPKEAVVASGEAASTGEGHPANGSGAVLVKDRFSRHIEELRQKRKADSRQNVYAAASRRDLKKSAEEKKKKRMQPKRQLEPETNASEQKKSKSDKPVIEENFIFNSIHKSKPSKESISNPKVALHKLEFERAKLSELKASAPEKAAELERKLQFKKAMQKAQGIVVKDDTKLLKKAIQRRDKEKNRSQEFWEKTTEQQKSAKGVKIEKRQVNIQARIDAKVAKKRGLKVKDGKKGKGGKGGKSFKKTGGHSKRK